MRKILPLLFLFIFSFSTSYAQNYGAKTIFKKYNDAVVVVYACDKYGEPFSQGSGVVLNSQGLIVTNFHVCKGSNNIKIKHEDLVIEDVTILGGSEENDWMFLKVAAGNFKHIPAGNSDNLEVGQKVYALGSPLGFENSITEGIVNGIRSIASLNGDFLQISASISPGSSGGALITAGGKLIGITTASRVDGQSINFAIPINRILASDIYIANSYDDSKSDITEKKTKKKKKKDDTFSSITSETKKKTKKTTPKKEKPKEDYRGDEGEGRATVPSVSESDKNKSGNKSGYKSSESASYQENLKKGRAAVEAENFEQGIKYFTMCIDAAPDESDGYLGRAMCYLATKKFQQALSDITFVINNKSEAESYEYLMRGIIYLQMGRYDDAERDLVKAVDMDKTSKMGFRFLGELYYQQKEYEKAALCFTGLILLDKSDPMGYLYRGICTAEGEISQSGACEDFRTAESLGMDEASEYIAVYCR